MTLSTYAADALLNLTLSGTAFTPPADLFAGWFVTPPSSAGGTELGGYTRQPITFDPPADGNIASAAAVEWTELDPIDDVMIAGVGVWDAEVGGNLLVVGRTSSTIIRGGLPVVIPAGLTLSSDDRSLTDYLVDAWLAHLLTATAYTAPAGTWLGLYTETPTAVAGTGAELAVAGYDRAAIDWYSAFLGLASNNGDVVWATVADDEVEVVGWAVLDDDTAGNVLFRSDWPNPLTVTDGSPLTVASNTLGVRIY